jgi:osmotically-inducible protein OsmY
MILAAGLIPHPDAKAPPTDESFARAAEDGRSWDRATPAESVTLHIDGGDARSSGVVPDLLVREPEEGDGRPNPAPAARRTLLRAVMTALVRERAVQSGVVTVIAARDGSIALTGDVRSPQEKRRAGQVAAAVDDVTLLDNRLSVTTAAERPDPAIESDVAARLKNDAQLDPKFIRINVANGMVTLSGAVGTATEKRRAVEDAWVAGVRHVEASKLNVRDWAQRPKRPDEKWATRGSVRDEAMQQHAEFPALRTPLPDSLPQ